NIFVTTTYCCVLSKQYEVHVVNKMPLPRMKVHCASADNDLGYHYAEPDYDLNWKFCENITGNTLYFCTLRWRNKEVSFNAFTSHLKNDPCSKGICRFEARIKGIYFSGGAFPTMTMLYFWKNHTGQFVL
ncbi:hypothetical protein MIMGU_mgv1a023453mg, partial [Erythranthe guttata]